MASPDLNTPVNRLLSGVPLPKMALVRQHFPEDFLTDPAGALREQLRESRIRERVRPGMSVAVSAGSRGIAAYVPLLRELVACLRGMGAEPFVFPAMGSHGGATAEGQRDLLAAYGITEESIRAPIRATMEVVCAGSTPEGNPVFIDRFAQEADGIVLFNRIKPHTGFRGDYESGLVKMAAVGLGKQKGAELVHRAGPAAMAESVRAYGSAAIAHAPILFGVATVENAYDRVAEVCALLPEEILVEEPRLLVTAKANLPAIRFPNLDVLAIDRIGKNISGPGMDPNITHTYLSGADIPAELRAQRAKRVVALDLTEETHGSAMGIGMADITTKRLFRAMDLESTYPNCLTSGVTESAKLPMMFDSHKLALQAAVQTIPGVDREQLRMVRIRDTLHLGEIWISEALLPEAETIPGVEPLSAAQDLPFDPEGNLFYSNRKK